MLASAASFSGCASPGPPRAPSLQLPELVSDLTATRRGENVALRFALPQRATDGLPLRSATLSASVCRAVEQGVCVPLASLPPTTLVRLTDGRATTAVLQDALDATLASGAPRLLTYRIEVRNDAGRGGGYSEAAYAAAGAAPAPVENLAAEGSRLGIVLHWKPAPGGGPQDDEVMLRREDVGAKPAPKSKAATSSPQHATHPRGATSGPRVVEGTEANAILLRASGSELESANSPALAGASTPRNITLDTTAVADEPYVYSAERRRSVQLGGRTLELHSADSSKVAYTLRAIYPPPAPTNLVAASFAATPPQTGILVDLIWQPVEDPHLAGYNVYREGVDAAGRAAGSTTTKQLLNTEPVRLPAFHDRLDKAIVEQSHLRYRYSVTALNGSGKESAAAVITLDARP